MCGIAGFFGPRETELLRAMAQRLAHRGPDGEGYFEHDALSFAHRRLAIIDPEGGHEPIKTDDGLLWLIYNGEVYNYRELAAELVRAGHVFHSHCDAEVVLHAYAEWGPSCFARFNGMWALAIADLRSGVGREELVLCRDHFGIKPLYVASAGDRTLFASEAKAILASPLVQPEPDRQWIYDYLAAGLHDHRTGSAFAGIEHVPAATWMRITPTGTERHRYWEPKLGRDEAVDPEAFRERFFRSVERRLVSDVPVGTCLSGGLDSSSIVAVSSRLLAANVPDARSLGDQLKTFSIVYPGDAIDERAYIDAVLAETDARSYFDTPTSQRWFDELDKVVWHQDEPIFSSAPYAQWCVMRLAKPEVTVLLNGQAGDELLAGYTPYQLVYLRELFGARKYVKCVQEALRARDVLVPLARRKLANRRKALDVGSVLQKSFTGALDAPPSARSQRDLKQRLSEDLTVFSLPSLLRAEDRNSMAFSMESRLPFLDQELVDWVLRLPTEALVDRGWSRAILRQGLNGVLPEKVRRRRWKVGFTTPESSWFKARRAAVQGVFRSPAFVDRPWWDASALAEAFDGFCAGRVEPSPLFWRALNVEAWQRVFVDSAERRGACPDRTVAQLGDDLFVRSSPSAAAARAELPSPHAQRHLFARSFIDGRAYARAPVRTRLFESGDDLLAGVKDALGDAAISLRPDDVVAISEKAVAICQGRSFPVDEIRARRSARILSRFVRRTSSGIGLGIPQTMELAVREAGTPRIVLAACAAAATRPFGVRGMFYRVAGPAVRAIDGPTRGTIPPYDGHAKMGPAHPDEVAVTLADALGARVAIIDANDIGVNILGASNGVSADVLVGVLRDNPLGQGDQQTPVAIIRRIDETSSAVIGR